MGLDTQRYQVPPTWVELDSPTLGGISTSILKLKKGGKKKHFNFSKAIYVNLQHIFIDKPWL